VTYKADEFYPWLKYFSQVRVFRVKVMYVNSRSVVKSSVLFEETKALGIRFWPCKILTFRLLFPVADVTENMMCYENLLIM
jgi:hypothetical protein